MNSIDEPWRLGAADLAARIARRELTATAVATCALARLDAVNPRLNAVVDLDRAEVLADAARADAALAAGAPVGLLHGVPVTTKVNVDQRGFATTNGVPANKDAVAMHDSLVVANLRRAGATLLGRTNTPAFSMRWFTDNALHGRTANPHGAGITPGGSSGGASAAVAAGLCAIGHGNDQGGSIRYPAYACGVYGLRPTSGRVPAFNPSAAGERPPMVHATSVQGPLARSVADIRLALAAMSVREPRDPLSFPVPAADAAASPRPRVALCLSVDGVPVDPVVAQSLRTAAGWLADAGYVVEDRQPPQLREAADLWLTLTMTDTRAMLDAALRGGGDPAIVTTYLGMLAHTPELDLAGYIRAQSRRITLQRAWAAFFCDTPLLLMPTSCQRPFPVDLDQRDDATMRGILDAQSPLLATAILSLPGLAVPMGIVHGLPTGVQLVADRFNEGLCLDAAEVIERATGPLQVVDPR